MTLHLTILIAVKRIKRQEITDKNVLQRQENTECDYNSYIIPLKNDI